MALTAMAAELHLRSAEEGGGGEHLLLHCHLYLCTVPPGVCIVVGHGKLHCSFLFKNTLHYLVAFFLVGLILSSFLVASLSHYSYQRKEDVMCFDGRQNTSI